MSAKSGLKSTLGLVVLVVAAGAGWKFFGDEVMTLVRGVDEPAVVHEATQRYKAAQRAYDREAVCLRAGEVAAAYRSVGDHNGAQRWAQIEAEDCKAAR